MALIVSSNRKKKKKIERGFGERTSVGGSNDVVIGKTVVEFRPRSSDFLWVRHSQLLSGLLCFNLNFLI